MDHCVKAGFCVYLAYQLLDNVSFDQMVGEAINKHVDITLKKKQLLTSLSGSKFLPQIDERIRKQIKEIREFMTSQQLDVVLKIKEIKIGQNMDMLVQLLALLNSKGIYSEKYLKTNIVFIPCQPPILNLRIPIFFYKIISVTKI